MIHVTCSESPRTKRFEFQTDWLGHTIEKSFVPRVRITTSTGNGYILGSFGFPIFAEIWQVDWFSRDLLRATARYIGIQRVAPLMSTAEKRLNPNRFPA